MNYLRSDIDTLVSRRDWLFTPTISYSFRVANGKIWQLAYNMEVATPDLETNNKSNRYIEAVVG